MVLLDISLVSSVFFISILIWFWIWENRNPKTGAIIFTAFSVIFYENLLSTLYTWLYDNDHHIIGNANIFHFHEFYLVFSATNFHRPNSNNNTHHHHQYQCIGLNHNYVYDYDIKRHHNDVYDYDKISNTKCPFSILVHPFLSAGPLSSFWFLKQLVECDWKLGKNYTIFFQKKTIKRMCYG